MEQEIKIRRVDFYPTDWLEGTISLTHQERSVYITICAAIYANGGPVEVQHVKKFCPGHGFKRAFDGLVRKAKVIPIGTGAELKVDQKRTHAELARARKRTDEALQNGAKGGRPKDLQKPGGFENRKPIKQQTSYKKDLLPTVVPASARACVPAHGAAHARDTGIAIATATPSLNGHDGETAWKQLGAIVGQPAAPAAPPLTLAQRCLDYLLLHGTPAECEAFGALLDAPDGIPPAVLETIAARIDDHA